MTTITIPGSPRPFTVMLNGRKYIFAPGEQTVDDDIAVLIKQALAKTSAPEVKPPFEVKDAVHAADLAPYAKSADVMTKASSITGYDATKAQMLVNDSGVLK